MEFFNKKEEVLEVILTQKGKQLFAKGKFNPVYYTFHDKDITYDNNADEEQNSIVERIKETPILKSNNNMGQESLTGIISIFEDRGVYNKEFLLKSELGSKTISDQYAPAWEIDFISCPLFQYVGLNRFQITDNKKYELSFSSSFEADKSNQELIPQFNIQTLYQIADVDSLKENRYYFKIKDSSKDFELGSMKESVYKKILDEKIVGDKISSAVEYFGSLDGAKAALAPNSSNVETQFDIENFSNKDKEKFVFAIKNKQNKIKIFFQEDLDKKINNYLLSYMLYVAEQLQKVFPIKFDSIEDIIKNFNSVLKDEPQFGDYEYDESQKIFDILDLMHESLKDFTVPDINGQDIVLAKSKDLIKRFEFEVFSTQWLIKDPSVLIRFNELNTWENDEFSEYELDYFIADDEKNTIYKINNEELKKYVNIYFDEQTTFGESKIKNIYGSSVEADETTC